MSGHDATAQTKVMREYDDVRESKPGGLYFVRSRTTEGAWWAIGTNGCTCPAGRQFHAKGLDRLCWHGRRLVAYLGAMADARRPAPAPVNVSAFVD